MIHLKNKTVIVTGATGHLGYVLSLGLRAHGARVIAVARNDSKKEKLKIFKKKGIEVYFADLMDARSVDNLFSRLSREKIPVHGLVNNASFVKGGGNLESTSYDEWRIGLEGTAGLTFRMLQKTIPFLRKTKGSVVNIASMYGMVSPQPAVYSKFPSFNIPPHYAAGKAAIIQLTKYAACYLAKDSIRVNAISPGAFPKPEVRKHKSFMAELEKRIPLGRVGNPEELVAPVAFLLSDSASYLTGQNLPIEGGWTVI